MKELLTDYIQYQPNIFTRYCEASGKIWCPLAAMICECNNTVYNVHEVVVHIAWNVREKSLYLSRQHSLFRKLSFCIYELWKRI